MKKCLLLLVSLAAGISAYAENAVFASKPALSPDASEIYFSWSGDIFRVPSKGGLALRMISMNGIESNPKISPDGKYLAFSSNETGNNNVYVVPVAGGAVVQLTFHDASDVPVSWSPDSKRIYFESNRYNSISIYSVPAEGGTPSRLFQNYFNTVAALVENPVNGELYFTESAESFRFATRKGYRGEHNANIISWNPAKKEYREVTSYLGRDLWPMTDSKGNLYYVSDEKNGEANLVKQEGDKRVWLTSFDESLQYPSISYDGSKIVFVKGYRLFLYDVKSGKSIQPVVEVADSKKTNDSFFKVEVPDDAAVSPDGKKLAFSFRGLLFVSDAKGKFAKMLSTPQSEKVDEIVWAQDNKTLYYTRTNRGYYNIFKQRADVAGEEKAVYEAPESARNLTASGKGGLIAFISGSRKVMVLNMESDKADKISEQEFWAFQGYSLSFSHDDKYLAFSAVNMFDRDIFVYSFADKKVLNLTNSATFEDNPQFSPDGKSMYLITNRTSPSFPRGSELSLYKVDLEKVPAPFEGEEYDKLFGNNAALRDSAVAIDRNYLQRRFTKIAERGTQNSPYILAIKEKTYLFYSSNHEGEPALYVQELKEWDQKPAQKVKGIANAGKYISNGKDLFVLGRGGLFKIDPAGASATKIEFEESFAKNIGAEFKQMFYEVWATLEQNFYDQKFHGVNWKDKRDYYESFLPYAKSRDDLRILLNDMLNELNSSHMGFSTFGKDEETPVRNFSVETGILFRNDNPYIVDRIVSGSKADFVSNPVKPGDRLVAVNGVKVNALVNRESYFVSPTSSKEVMLRFANAGGAEYDVRLHTMNSGELRSLLYTEWEDGNRAVVERLGGGKIAYVHMRDMGNGSLENFLIDMNTYAVHKEALILDLRFNNGGNVHKEVLDFLSQKQHFKWKFRDGELASHPNVTPANKPIVVLINERSLSDAEVTSNGIKALSIAKLVGTETYRWIIFTSGVSLVDGSNVRLPAWGCYTLDGKDMEFSGVAPDIYVKNTFRDRLESKDPQLERAIKELLPL